MKTVFFLGAGSSKCFDIPLSSEQKTIFGSFANSKHQLLNILHTYINDCFGDDFTINDLFNVIDNALLMRCGLCFRGKEYLTYPQLIDCKTKLIESIRDVFFTKTKDLDKEKYEQVVSFYSFLAEYEKTKKIELIEKEPLKRNNFIADYSIINLNWDLFSTFAVLNGNRKANEKDIVLFNKRNSYLKIFTDFNCEQASNNSDGLWYPVTEAVAARTNDPKYLSNRTCMLVKAYFPHGSFNLFKCPSCGKHSFFFDDQFDILETNKLINESEKPLYECPYCKTKINKDNYDVLVQSNFKEINSYFTESRLSMISTLESADTIFFIGYSMPKDDVDYRTILKKATKDKRVFIVLYEKDSIHKGFISKDEVLKDKLNGESGSFDEFCNVTTKAKEVYFCFNGFIDSIPYIQDVYKKLDGGTL